MGYRDHRPSSRRVSSCACSAAARCLPLLSAARARRRHAGRNCNRAHRLGRPGLQDLAQGRERQSRDPPRPRRLHITVQNLSDPPRRGAQLPPDGPGRGRSRDRRRRRRDDDLGRDLRRRHLHLPVRLPPAADERHLHAPARSAAAAADEAEGQGRPGNSISLKKGRRRVRSLKAGQVHDQRPRPDREGQLPPDGPGVSKKTGGQAQGKATWKVTLQARASTRTSPTRTRRCERLGQLVAAAGLTSLRFAAGGVDVACGRAPRSARRRRGSPRRSSSARAGG